MFHFFIAVAMLVGGFGLGRVKHPANSKLSAVKAEIAKIEAEVVVDAKAVVARVKALL
jgi:hypothetical protein